jgi:LPXTG-motif cell wall-anchored protein
MWLPTRVYENLPYAYVIGGLLFVAGAIYLGTGNSVSPLYLALGIISICSGILVFIKRRHVRNQNSRALSQDESE